MKNITIPEERSRAALCKHRSELEAKLLPGLKKGTETKIEELESQFSVEDIQANLLRQYQSNRNTAIEMGVHGHEFDTSLQESMQDLAGKLRPNRFQRVYDTITRDILRLNKEENPIASLTMLAGGIAGMYGAGTGIDMLGDANFLLDGAGYVAGFCVGLVTTIAIGLGLDSILHYGVNKKFKSANNADYLAKDEKTAETLYKFKQLAGKIDYDVVLSRSVDIKNHRERKERLAQEKINQYQAARDAVVTPLEWRGYDREEIKSLFDEFYRSATKVDAKVIAKQVLTRIEKLEEASAVELFKEEYAAKEKKALEEIS
jgi:hypothetical protein